MRKLRKKMLAALMSVVMIASCVFATGINASAAPSDLPVNVIIGYWHNFDNGSTTTRLGDVNQNWDVVIASFLTTGGDYCTAEFEPDSSIYPTNAKAEFIKDVKALQARGVKVLVSLGGQNGHIELKTTAQRDKFLSTAIAVVKEYGFDGFDVDLEGSSITVDSSDTVAECNSAVQKNLNYILHELVKAMGSDFMITMAPEHPYVQGGMVALGSPWGAYLPLLNNCRDILTFIHPQYYNNAIDYWLPDGGRITGYSATSLVKMSELLIDGFSTPKGDFAGLRPDQVAFGVPASRSAAGSGTLAISEYQSALRTLIQKYPTFRGIMTWSTNWDEKENSSGFVNGMRSVIGDRTYGTGGTTTPLSISSLSSNVSGIISSGTEVSWSVAAAGGKSPYTYKFEVYKDNVISATQDFSTYAGTSATLTQAGIYKAVVTVKDSTGATVSKTSDNITVTKPATNKKEFAMRLNSSYALVNGTKQQTAAYNNDGTGTYYAQLQMVNSKTLLPIRYVAEAFGLTVGYDAMANATTVSDGTTTITVPLGSSTMTKVVNGGTPTNVFAGADAVLIRNVTHVPVRALLESFSLTVNWDDSGYLLVTDYTPTSSEIADLLSKAQAQLA